MSGQPPARRDGVLYRVKSVVPHKVCAYQMCRSDAVGLQPMHLYLLRHCGAFFCSAECYSSTPCRTCLLVLVRSLLLRVGLPVTDLLRWGVGQIARNNWSCAEVSSKSTTQPQRCRGDSMLWLRLPTAGLNVITEDPLHACMFCIEMQ